MLGLSVDDLCFHHMHKLPVGEAPINICAAQDRYNIYKDLKNSNNRRKTYGRWRTCLDGDNPKRMEHKEGQKTTDMPGPSRSITNINADLHPPIHEVDIGGLLTRDAPRQLIGVLSLRAPVNNAVVGDALPAGASALSVCRMDGASGHPLHLCSRRDEIGVCLALGRDWPPRQFWCCLCWSRWCSSTSSGEWACLGIDRLK